MANKKLGCTHYRELLVLWNIFLYVYVQETLKYYRHFLLMEHFSACFYARNIKYYRHFFICSSTFIIYLIIYIHTVRTTLIHQLDTSSHEIIWIDFTGVVQQFANTTVNRVYQRNNFTSLADYIFAVEFYYVYKWRSEST